MAEPFGKIKLLYSGKVIARKNIHVIGNFIVIRNVLWKNEIRRDRQWKIEPGQIVAFDNVIVEIIQIGPVFHEVLRRFGVFQIGNLQIAEIL